MYDYEDSREETLFTPKPVGSTVRMGYQLHDLRNPISLLPAYITVLKL